jgi:hypothetical protein
MHVAMELGELKWSPLAGMMWKVWWMMGRAFSGSVQIGKTQFFGKNGSNLGLSAFPKVNHIPITITIIS